MTSPEQAPAEHTERGEIPPAARTWSAGHVIGVVLVALTFGTLLNAQELLETAERQPFGWQRDVGVALAEPVAGFAAAVGLDTPRETLEVALGRGPAPAAAEEAPDGVVEAAPTPSEQPSASTPTATPSPSPTPTEPETLNGVARGPVTAAAPLKLYIGGDSMVEIQFGMALEDLADDTGMIEVQAIDFDRGSGLSRPDFVDWPARLAGVSADLAPDVMVVYFGGNDAQPLKVDGTVYEPEDPEWQAEYRSRVAALMDQLSDAGHHVYWMGLPIPSSQKMQTRFGILNTIYEEEAVTRDAITFVPMWDVFADDNGNYAEYLANQNGDVVDMRLNDGIHLTTAGAYRAARPTIARIIEDFAING